VSDSPEARLAALGLTLPPVAAPLAAYVPAVRSGPWVYTAGQLPLADGKLLMTGKVGRR
jgi:enamine deaminase RidA (YjgF/YER057c/UK114 family)